MTSADEFPAALAAVAEIDFPYDKESDIDYEPYTEFMSVEQAVVWWRAWTGNSEIDDCPFRVFGQDGTGGYVAFWIARPGKALVDQPVVFLGSEGARGVVARDLAAYLWLLAAGSGPMESVEYGSEWEMAPRPELAAIATGFAPEREQSPEDILAEAGEDLPDFDAYVESLIR